MSKPKIGSIVVDTLTGIQQNQFMSESKKPGHDEWMDFGKDLYKFIIDLQKRGMELILILGPEGSGKSFGMKELPTGTNLWVNCDNKQPTWKGGRVEYGGKESPNKALHIIPEDYDDILKHIDLLQKNNLFEDRVICFLTGHVEDYKSGRDMRQRMKTLGKIATKQNIEGKFECVFYSAVEKEGKDLKYVFNTANSGLNTCRTYEGLFDSVQISNDYNQIKQAVLNY